MKTKPPEGGGAEEEAGVVEAEGLNVDPAKEKTAGAVGRAGTSDFFSSTFFGSGVAAAAGGVVKIEGIVGGVGLSPSTSISLSLPFSSTCFTDPELLSKSF